jgi:hypothetical protein
MKGEKELDVKKNYVVPTVVSRCVEPKDVLCMSNEANDNDFGAGGFGGFIDGGKQE